VSGGVITEVGKRAAILEKYRPATLIDEPDSIVIPGMINGHRHLLCCAKGAMPEVGARNVRRQQMAGAGRTPPCAFSSLHFVVKATALGRRRPVKRARALSRHLQAKSYEMGG